MLFLYNDYLQEILSSYDKKEAAHEEQPPFWGFDAPVNSSTMLKAILFLLSCRQQQDNRLLQKGKAYCNWLAKVRRRLYKIPALNFKRIVYHIFGSGMTSLSLTEQKPTGCKQNMKMQALVSSY